jgi:signal recognition particle subunit SRP54
MPIFEGLSDRLQDVFTQLGRKGKLTEEDVDTALREVRVALLEADVNLKVAKNFIKRVRERAIGAEVQKSLRPAQQVIKIVNEELIETLGEAEGLNLTGAVPRVIMLVGLQGSGKTTTAAKMALMLRRDGYSPFMIAADTYRPAAVDQLVTNAKQIDMPYYEEGVSAAPPDIAKRGVKAAQEAGANIVIIDTAGRLQINDELMNELEAIKANTHPAEILLVADAMTGQEAVRIAEGFNERVGLTGLILTKVDGDARGGAAISMREVTGVPIKFMGVGEKLDGFELFYPDRLASRILGMGDMLSLIEQAEEVFDEKEAERLQRKMLKNEFTLDDFLNQMKQIKRMGSIGKILDMLPGMGRLRSQFNFNDQEAQERMKRVEAIILSMTAQERQHANPAKFLNGSRKRRIADGSGTTVQEVNQLMRQFRDMKKMLKDIQRGKMPNIPGMPGMQ